MTKNSDGTRSKREVRARNRAYKEDSASACSKISRWWKKACAKIRPSRRARDEKCRWDVGGIEIREGNTRGEFRRAVALSTV